MGLVKAALALLLLAGAPASAEPLDRWAVPIGEAAMRFGLPPAWIRSVMRVESGGEIRIGGRPVVSTAGAMGLMQLMPATWRDMRNLLDLGPDPFDPHDNILAGAAYLRLMYDRFGYPGLFGAYNAGPGRYSAALTGARALPAETRAYVRRVTGWRGPPATDRQASPLFPRVAPSPAAAGAAPGGAGLFVKLGNLARR